MSDATSVTRGHSCGGLSGTGHSLLGGSRARWGQWGKGGVREELADTWTGSRRLGRKRVSFRVEVSPGPELGAPGERTRRETGEGVGGLPLWPWQSAGVEVLEGLQG